MSLFNKRVRAIQVRSMDEFDNLTGTGKPVLVDFFQHGCRPCQVMDGIVDEIAAEFAGDALVVKANLDHVPDLFHKFKVKSTPTFVMLNPMNGGLHQRWRQSGLVKKDAMVGQVSNAIEAARH